MSTQAPSTERIRESWDAIATRFDEFVTPKSVLFGENALRRADSAPTCGSSTWPPGQER